MTPGQRQILDRYVQGAVAQALDVPLAHVMPTTKLFVGRVFSESVTFDHLKDIADCIENYYRKDGFPAFQFPVLAYRAWTQVSDITESVYGAIMQQEKAA